MSSTLSTRLIVNHNINRTHMKNTHRKKSCTKKKKYSAILSYELYNYKDQITIKINFKVPKNFV